MGCTYPIFFSTNLSSDNVLSWFEIVSLMFLSCSCFSANPGHRIYGRYRRLLPSLVDLVPVFEGWNVF